MRTLLLVGMLLLPRLAWADGWLIWIELTLAEKDHPPATSWSILGTKGTEQACHVTVEEYLAQWKKPGRQGDEVSVQGSTVTVRRSSPAGASERYTYSCLSAGTDPRPREEK